MTVAWEAGRAAVDGYNGAKGAKSSILIFEQYNDTVDAWHAR